MDREWREIRTAADAESIRQAVEELAEGSPYIDAGKVDWDSFLYKLEELHNFDLGSDMASPAIRRIKKIVRELLKEV